MFDVILLVQFFTLLICIYIFLYKNIYYTLLYTFIFFFFIGLLLALSQVELFTAFLWLVECSVLFIFLLLLFFLNVKGNYNYSYNHLYYYFFIFFFLLFLSLYGKYSVEFFSFTSVFTFLYLFENYYESLINLIINDLFSFFISYYIINIIEFLIIGFLLLLGSVICVNLHQLSKNTRSQSYYSFLLLFSFFNDFSSFLFLRKQNIIKQGNSKPSLKIFKKK